MSVAELIEILQTMPQHLPVEINNEWAGDITFVDKISLFSEDNPYFSVDEDYPAVIIHTETE